MTVTVGGRRACHGPVRRIVTQPMPGTSFGDLAVTSRHPTCDHGGMATPTSTAPTALPPGAGRVRRAAAEVLLRRVAGPEPHAARDRIHGAPGPRWFHPDSPMGRVHGDASMYPAGVRALLLQSLHPRAMAAVAHHSDYRTDPWGRLQRTATFIATTTFAPVDDAERACAVVRAVHRHVHGTTADGEPYDASDPHLLRWVHVAEVDSFLVAHQRYGRRPLDRAGCDEYVAQAAVVARRLGATDVPTTVAGLRDTLEAFRPELRVTPEALEAAGLLLHRPPLPAAVVPAYKVLTSAGVSLLPRWARRPLGLPDLPPLEAAVVRPVGRLVTAGIRWALDSTPPARPADPLELVRP